MKTTADGFGSCSSEWTNYTSNVNILPPFFLPASLWFTASPSHPCQDHFVACVFYFSNHTKQKETHGGIYDVGVAAPALEAHGSHSVSISIFILAFQECRWPDALVTRLGIDSHSIGRRHGAWTARCQTNSWRQRQEQEEFTTDFVRLTTGSCCCAVVSLVKMKLSNTNMLLNEDKRKRG